MTTGTGLRPRSAPHPGGRRAVKDQPDAVAVRLVARARVGLAVGAAATGSFLPGLSPDQERMFLLLGLVWVPLACVVLFAADGRDTRVALVGGPAGDMAALLTLQFLVPQAATAALLGHFAIVAFAAYTAGRVLGGVLAVTAVGAGVMELANGSMEWPVLGVFALAVFAIVGLVDRSAIVEGRTRAHSEQLQLKSDAILSRIADAVIVTDANGSVLQWNAAAGRLVGTMDALGTGLSCADVLGLHVGERALDCRSGCPLLGTGGSPNNDLGIEVWRWDATERRQPLLANAEAIHDRAGAVVEVVHSLRDITKLKQADEAKTLFLATASHELKTPLTVINGFVETVLATDLPPDQRLEALDAVRRRALELNRIVDRLLLSSRIEAGRVRIAVGPLDLSEIVTERAAALQAATGRRFDVQTAEMPLVIGEPAALATIIDHLLDNAVKYSPEGQSVSVRLEADGAAVRLIVADEGIGMDAEQAANCFDKFWQAETTDVRRFGGTGIGLYIVKSLVEAMGGRISVVSEPGQGSVFTVELKPATTESGGGDSDQGESSSIREFMRQIGVPQAGNPPALPPDGSKARPEGDGAGTGQTATQGPLR